MIFHDTYKVKYFNDLNYRSALILYDCLKLLSLQLP